MNQRPCYTNKNSTQTLREGLEEYYALNPHVTPPSSQPPEFAEILQAHDVGHVIYGCDTRMYDELKILPLFWWTSECTFVRYLKMKNSPAVEVMYEDMIKEKAVISGADSWVWNDDKKKSSLYLAPAEFLRL